VLGGGILVGGRGSRRSVEIGSSGVVYWCCMFVAGGIGNVAGRNLASPIFFGCYVYIDAEEKAIDLLILYILPFLKLDKPAPLCFFEASCFFSCSFVQLK
jgi:hypothetical protein